MDLILRYLENARRLRDMAAAETDPKLRDELKKQEMAYRKMAQERAQERNLPLPDKAD
jgi:hypothetical protein